MKWHQSLGTNAATQLIDIPECQFFICCEIRQPKIIKAALLSCAWHENSHNRSLTQKTFLPTLPKPYHNLILEATK
jgi:hypothetical protein